MLDLLMAAGVGFWHVDLWYALPAIVAVSLVYAATRHEQIRPILIHAARTGVWILGFMAVVFLALRAIDWFL